MATSSLNKSSLNSGTKYTNLSTGSAKPTVSGGTLTSDTTYYYRTFTASGTLTVSGGALLCDIVHIAGGGRGGSIPGYISGGGAGGVVYTEKYTISSGSALTITVGGSGNNTSVTGLTDAVAGAPGVSINASGNGPYSSAGYDGGCGSGAVNGSYVSAQNGGKATWRQGQDGGAVQQSSGGYAGGGGAGGPGGPGTNAFGGQALYALSSWATATGTGVGGGYAGGGAAVGYPSAAGAGAPGSYNTAGGNGTANTGSASGAGAPSGLAGSGLVMVRYLKTAVD